MKKAVFGIAKTENQAISIANQLQSAGFSPNDISVLFPDKTGTRDFAHEQHTKAPEGAATGAGGGAVLGGALGWMVGIGALAIPGLGPFIAAGPIMAALAGAGAGAIAAVLAARPRRGAGGGGGGGGAKGFRNFSISVRERSLPSSSNMKTSCASLGYSGS